MKAWTAVWRGLVTLLLGLALWIAASLFEGLAGGLAARSFLSARVVIGIGFLLIFFGPVLFWIILPLRDKWYESHPKRFIVVVIPFVLFLLVILGGVISFVLHEPQLPEYSFSVTPAGNSVIVDVRRTSEGDLPDLLTLKLTDTEGKLVDLHFISNQDFSNSEKTVEFKKSYFGTPESGNYTLTIGNIRNETIYQRKI
jgi:hypothetical protein